METFSTSFRQLVRLAITFAALSVGSPALAKPKDAATQKKIEEALDVHLFAGRTEKAESVLRAAIKGCAGKACSGEVLAKAHVGLGVVLGKSSKNLREARKEFERAKEADPDATIDAKYASRDVLVEFYKVMGKSAPSETTGSKSGTYGAPVGKLHCTPASGHEIQTAQPIAVVCDPLEGVVRAELHYRMDGESEYSALLMTVQDGTLRANIPCEPLGKPGKLDVYIIAQDFSKEKIDSFGSSVNPAQYKIVDSTKDPVPSYPGQEPPKRCNELLIGVAALGEPCSSTQPCKHGLYCGAGSCKKAPACETDSECASSHCNNGYCAMDEDDEPETEDSKPSNWMVGLHGGVDFWVVPSSKRVCSDESLRAGDFACYNRGEDVLYTSATRTNSNHLTVADTNSSGNVDSGLRMGTIRVMASVDRVLKKYLTVGIRLGWAFGGGPPAIDYNSEGTPKRAARFIPVHAELRGTYWFRSLGKPGFHPYVNLSAGLGQVDVNTPIKARLNGNPRELDAWRKLGPAFVGPGLGVLYSVNKKFGIQLNVNANLMLPATGIVIEPSLGGVVAF